MATIAEVKNYTEKCDKECSLITCHLCTSTNVDMCSIKELDREVSLISCHSSSASTTSVWYMDGGASSHMAGVCHHFIDLTETGLDLKVVLGDNTSVRAVRRGTVSF